MSLLQSIKQNEGFRSEIYKDSLGFNTIGYGFLENALTPDELAINGGKITPMSRQIADKILELKLEKLKVELFKRLGWLKEHNEIVQDVLLEMSYQLGIDGVLCFKNTLKMIESKDYENASANILKSKWAMQTPQRARKLSSRLKNANA